jgi:plastocyanin
MKLDRRRFLYLLGGLTLGAGCSALNSEPDFTVTIRRDGKFDPAVLTVPIGATVAWHNLADSVHTVTADPQRVHTPTRVILPEGALPFDSGDLFPGARWVYTFGVAGRYVYLCRYHASPEILGMITVSA